MANVPPDFLKDVDWRALDNTPHRMATRRRVAAVDQMIELGYRWDHLAGKWLPPKVDGDVLLIGLHQAVTNLHLALSSGTVEPLSGLETKSIQDAIAEIKRLRSVTEHPIMSRRINESEHSE